MKISTILTSINNSLIFFFSTFLVVTSALACDLCGIYTSVDSQKPITGALRLGVAEQFTEFGTLLDNGHKMENDEHQRLTSAVTQLLASYDLSNSFGLQLSLPYINRRFTRVENNLTQRGTEAGIGDLTFIGRYTPIQYRNGDTLANFQFLGGIKLPTGDSERLKEELSEDHEEMDDDGEDEGHMDEATIMHSRHGRVEHGGTPSAVHGHDLALGSGSVDFPIGVSLFAETGRLFLKGTAIYAIRTQGDYAYQYANDLLWDVGPGYYLYLDHDTQVAFRAVLSGENKGKDSGKDNAVQGDTALQSTFIGPELILTTVHSLSGQLGYDIPLDINNSEVQSVATHRIRVGLTYNF